MAFGGQQASGPASSGTLGGMAAYRAGEIGAPASATNLGTSQAIGWAQPGGFDWSRFFQGLQTPAGSVGMSGPRSPASIPGGGQPAIADAGQAEAVLRSFLQAVTAMMGKAQTPQKALAAPGGR